MIAMQERLRKIKHTRETHQLLVQSFQGQSFGTSSISASAPTSSNLAPANSSNLLPLSKTEYPQVHYWTKKQWDNKKDTLGSTKINQNAPQRGKTRIANGENMALRFIEDSNGVVVDGYQVNKMRTLSNQIWTHLHDQGVSPVTWAQGSHIIQSYYHSTMYDRFPKLQLCEGHWKVDQIAISSYPGWYRNHKNADVKQEPDLQDVPAMKCKSHTKRSSTSDLTSTAPHKKLKVPVATPTTQPAGIPETPPLTRPLPQKVSSLPASESLTVPSPAIPATPPATPSFLPTENV